MGDPRPNPRWQAGAVRDRHDLTAYQLRILELLAQGYSHADIAARLPSTRWAVKSAVTKMFDKFGARNAANLVHRAWQRGVFDDDGPEAA